MGQGRPVVREGLLYSGRSAPPSKPAENKSAGEQKTTPLGSPEWYAWLEDHSHFVYMLPTLHFTARKEKRSGGNYWYAYRRYQGKLHTAYLGKSHELTEQRLNSAADTLEFASKPCDLEDARNDTPGTGAVPHHAGPKQALAGTPPAPLPVPLTPLIGRDKDVADASALLMREDVRLVSLIGMGGVGKTRIAIQVAAKMRGSFEDGVYFVALAPVRDPQLVLSTIAQAFGLKEEPNIPLAELLQEFLAGKQVLLVLDNFEQVMPAASLVVEMLSACPRLKVLATSRESMHICSEHHFYVAPLAFPDPDNLPPIESFYTYPAVSLFFQRAQTISPAMATNPATIQAVAQVCARLEGLPLAIELAAARVKLLPPQALATRLKHRLDVLTQGGPDMPERHRTLRATFAWSRDLLTPDEQRVFRRLSVFVGGCSLEAAEAVCAAPGVEPLREAFLDVVSSLVAKSLLNTQYDQGREPRIYLLETVREYALECLLESGEMDFVQAAHAAYYVCFAELAEPEFYGTGQWLWLGLLDTDNENLRAAFSFYLERGCTEPAVRLTGALGWYWYMRGRLHEGLDWARQALRGMEVTGVGPTERKALFAAGIFASHLGQRDQARAWLKKSLELCRGEGDTRGFAKASFALAQLALVGGDLSTAQSRAEEALAFMQGTDDGWTLGMVLNVMGLAAMCRGDLLGAGMLCERSTALFTEAGDMYMRNQVLLMVGNALLAEGDEKGARNLMERLMHGPDAERSSWMAGWTLCAYGEIALQLGEGDRARFLLEQALSQSRRVGNHHGMAKASSLLAQVALAAQDLSMAKYAALQSVQNAQSAGDKEAVVGCLEGMGDAVAQQGQIEWAVRLWGAAERQRETGTHAGSTQPSRQPMIEGARRSMGSTLFGAAWVDGRTLTPEEALAAQPSRASLAHYIASRMNGPAEPCERPAGLTKRELEALMLVAEGLSNDKIACRLMISTTTVKTYLSTIYSKLGVTSRTGAMKYVIDHHLQFAAAQVAEA